LRSGIADYQIPDLAKSNNLEITEAIRATKIDVPGFIHSHAVALPPIAKFALAMAIIVGIPPLSRRVRIPGVVGLLLSGVVLGPHVLGLFAEHHPIVDFLAELGKAATHVLRWHGD